MRLYYSGNSKNNIGYTVDTLQIEGNGICYNYDLQGSQDYMPEEFSGKFKGDIYKWIIVDKDGNEIENEDYDDLTEEEENELIRLLSDDSYEKTLNIYPDTLGHDEDDEDDDYWDRVRTDEITDVEATLEIGDNEVTFKCRAEFVA